MGQPSSKCLYRLSNTLWQLLWCVINTLWPRIRGECQPSGKYELFAKVASTLWGICQRVANNRWHLTNLPEGCQYPLTPCNKFAWGLIITYSTFARGSPNYTKRGNHCAIPLNKVKYKVKNQEEINSYKNYQGSLSICTTNRPSQSRDSPFKVPTFGYGNSIHFCTVLT